MRRFLQALGYMHKQITDPTLREKLTPRYTMGCKRVLLSDDFYPALTQSNVELVTERIHEVRAHSIVTEDGTEREIDAIICATGFGVAETQLAHRIHGHNGQSLADAWGACHSTYLGTTITGFPNLFVLLGPNTRLSHGSLVFMHE